MTPNPSVEKELVDIVTYLRLGSAECELSDSAQDYIRDCLTIVYMAGVTAGTVEAAKMLAPLNDGPF